MRPEVPKGRKPFVDFPPMFGQPARTFPIAEATKIALRFHANKDLQTAAHLFQLILEADPEFIEARFYYGMVLHQTNQSDAGIEMMKRAAQQAPHKFEYYSNLGIVHDERREDHAALTAFRKSFEMNPIADTAYNLGVILLNLSNLEESATYFRKAIQMQPRHKATSSMNNLASVLYKQGKIAEAIAEYKSASELSPEDSMIHSNSLFMLNFLPQPDPVAILKEHTLFARKYEDPIRKKNKDAELALAVFKRDPNRRLRIGYLSPDFHQHSVIHFIEPVLAEHDQSKFELFCYYHHLAEDDITKRIRAMVPHWRNIVGPSDEQIADMVRKDQIDILVDLAGHAGLNRLTLFAHKPSPIQVTWLGYPNTTGLSTMDYRITDAFADPPGMTEAFHSETLVRMPECFSCFKAPIQSPDVGPLPALSSGHITFGSFNMFSKMTPDVLATWSRILLRVPNSKMVIKYQGMDSEFMYELIHGIFTSHDVAKERVIILGRDDSHGDHMGRYNTIDIGLDPFPYNGTTTTLDALWMGVPVVVLAGNTHVSRVGVSQMSNLNLQEMIAQNTDEYVDIATALANDLPRLAALRDGLRQRMATSPLTNVPRFTRFLETAYQDMWSRYIEKIASGI
jgi:protein O-GlcNAc transferase